MPDNTKDLDKNLNVEGMIDDFISQLVVEAGMGKDLEGEVLNQLKSDLKERLENRINATILSQVPESKLEEFEKLVNDGNQNDTQAFCLENIPNMNELIASEFLSFRNRYISEVKE